MTFIAGVLAFERESDATKRLIQQEFPSNLSWRSLEGNKFSIGVAPTIRLPEDAYDQQPLNASGIGLIGDIRIDNREEIAALLGWSLAEIIEKADSDIFLAAWVRWREDALQRMVGGFAVAIWDQSSHELTLVRDHVGERPLYFLHVGDRFAFASLPGPLRAVRDVDTSLDEDRMIQHLAILTCRSTQTFFKNIQQVPAGHVLNLQDGLLRLRSYWHPIDAPAIRFKSDHDYVEAFCELFDKAVTARLRTVGNVSSQLSGGMDSSSVTATAARLLGGTRLTAFTSVPKKGFHGINPAGRFGDEGPAAARLVAMYQNIDHVLVDSSERNLLSDIEQMGLLQGHPVLNPLNQMWDTAMLDESKSRGISVMLQGTCGNATFSASGIVGLSQLFRQGRWVKLTNLVYLLRKRGHVGLRNAAYFAIGPVLSEWARRNLSPQVQTYSLRYSPIHPNLIQSCELLEKTLDGFFSNDRSVEAYRRLMFDYYDAGYVNGASTLGWQIECRDPTQDKRIFDFCYGIPIEQYLVGGQTRSLVRRAMKGRVPDSTLACRDRGLQAADWYLTLGARRQEMRNEMARIRTSPIAKRLLDLDRLDMLLDHWPNEGFERDEVSDAWHLALTRGLSAGNFIRQFEP